MQEEWSRKGATLSDKTARKEFGLTQEEIAAAIDAGQLQYRVGVIHGNPWLRLLRREVEELMDSTYQDRDHRQRRARAEVARVDRELKRLRAEVGTDVSRGQIPAAGRVLGSTVAVGPHSPIVRRSRTPLPKAHGSPR